MTIQVFKSKQQQAIIINLSSKRRRSWTHRYVAFAKEGCDHMFIVVSTLLAHIVAVIKLYVGR